VVRTRKPEPSEKRTETIHVHRRAPRSRIRASSFLVPALVGDKSNQMLARIRRGVFLRKQRMREWKDRYSWGTEMVEQLCALANCDWIPATEKSDLFRSLYSLSREKGSQRTVSAQTVGVTSLRESGSAWMWMVFSNYSVCLTDPVFFFFCLHPSRPPTFTSNFSRDPKLRLAKTRSNSIFLELVVLCS
jgi:hypothetical protein